MTVLQMLAKAEMEHHTMTARINGHLGRAESAPAPAAVAADPSEMEWCDLKTD